MGESKFVALLRVRVRKMLSDKVLRYSRGAEIGASLMEFSIKLVHYRIVYT